MVENSVWYLTLKEAKIDLTPYSQLLKKIKKKNDKRK